MRSVLVAAVLVLASACGASAQTEQPAVKPFPDMAVVDYQLGGPYAPDDDVTVVVRDSTEKSAGRYDVCYVNTFQTQPGSLSWWKRKHPKLLLRSHGTLVTDPGWPDEVILDLRTASRRAGLAKIYRSWFRGCAKAGYEAIEADNLDSYTRSKKLLTRAQAVATARLLVREAHAAGLAVGQKNTPDVDGTKIGFDFAVAEECQVYRECGSYTRLYGSKVVEIEYTDNGRKAYATACRLHAGKHSILLRDRDVVPRGDEAYVFEHC